VALALYRKYRPRTFAEVIGQEHVTEPLSQALRTGRLHHAYLFSGPRGCGKTSSARILARSLNCEKGPTPTPCGECESCQALAPDGAGSIDVIEIDAASHGGVDDARELRERAFFAPVASRFKVYVIDEAHMVSSAGFNALLKLVEEPPEYVTFVFATTEPEKVLGTIKSRTHHYPFRLIPPGVLRPYLEQLCHSEGVTVEPAVFPLVVRAGAGSVRDSLSVLDQLIAGAGAEGVTYARAVGLLGVTDAALIDEMCDAIGAGDGAAAYSTIERVAEAGHDPRRFASDLLDRLRDLIVLQQVPDAAAKGLLDAPADQLDRMAAQADRFGPATLSRCADIVHNGLTEMRGTTAPRLLLELICARMLLPGAEESTGALLHRLERMERRLGAGMVAAPELEAMPTPLPIPAPEGHAPQPAERKPEPVAKQPEPVDSKPEPAAKKQEPSDPGTIDAAAVRRVWDEVLTMVRRQGQRHWALVREATVRDVQADTLVLVFKHSFHANTLAENPSVLTDAVAEVLGGRWQVRCEFAGERATGTGERATGTAERATGTGERATGTGGKAAGTGGKASGTGVRATASERPPSAAKARTKAKPATPVQRTPEPAADDWPATAVPGGDSPASAHNSVDEDTVPEEPPFDPEYDAPAFDPGDGPADDGADRSSPRASSEEQALRLLSETLGAEKIGEADRH
jgi:DNA polymerase-3 subunit gamma/tau